MDEEDTTDAAAPEPDDSDDINRRRLNEEGWVSIELNDDLIIRYRKRGNKLPISSWTVTKGYPCLDP